MKEAWGGQKQHCDAPLLPDGEGAPNRNGNPITGSEGPRPLPITIVAVLALGLVIFAGSGNSPSTFGQGSSTTVWARGWEGVWRSDDGGDTWQLDEADAAIAELTRLSVPSGVGCINFCPGQPLWYRQRQLAGAGASAWLVANAQRGTTDQPGRAATLAEVAARVNPPGADRYPVIVARITSGEFSNDALGKALAGLVEAAKVRGDPLSEREARDQLITAGLLQLAVQKRGLEASEEEAADLYREVAACLAGAAVPGAPCSGPPPPDIAEIGQYILANSTEAQLIEAYRSGLSLGRLRSEILRDLTPEERANPTTVDERYAAFIEQERRSAAVIEVFGENGDFGCTEDGDETPCPSDILATLEQGRAP